MPEGYNIGIWQESFILGGHVDQDTIVMRPDYAEGMLSTEEPMLGDRGISKAAEVFLEELLHAMILTADLQDDFENGKKEDHFTHAVTTVIFPQCVAIMRMLAYDGVSALDLVRIRNGVLLMRSRIAWLKTQFPGDLIDRAPRALGWRDDDGDGLLDWLEQRLRDAGLDPDLPDWFPTELPPPRRRRKPSPRR